MEYGEKERLSHRVLETIEKIVDLLKWSKKRGEQMKYLEKSIHKSD